MRANWKDNVVAQSEDTVVVEGNLAAQEIEGRAACRRGVEVAP